MKHDTIPPITNRIFTLLEQKKISQSELARIINIKQSTISGWKQRKNEPEAELLEPISKALNVSIQWLITGNENLHEKIPEEEQQLLNFFKQCNQEGKNRILEHAEFIASKYPQERRLYNYKTG